MAPQCYQGTERDVPNQYLKKPVNVLFAFKRDLPVQIFIASLTSVITLPFLFKLASLFLNAKQCVAGFFSILVWNISSSTAGTALWIANFATLLRLLAIYFSVRSAKLNESQPWYLIASFLCCILMQTNNGYSFPVRPSFLFATFKSCQKPSFFSISGRLHII